MELDRTPSAPLEEPVTTRDLPLTRALNKDKWRIKERVKAPSILQCIFGQRNCARSVYYFTTGRKVDKNKIRDVGQEPSPFWYPPDTEQFCYKVLETSWRQQIRDKEKNLKYFERPNYRTRQKEDLLERLYIPEEKVDKIAHPAMLDIDPDFFRIIEGRPERLEKFDIHKYIEDVRQCLKTKLQTGYFEDETFKIDERFEEEQKKIDKIKATHLLYVKSFEEFLAKDHEDAMAVLRKADRVARTTEALEQEYYSMVQEFNGLSSRIYVLHDDWRDVKLCQRFVYLIGPIKWRMEYDYINRSEGGELELLGEGSISFLWVYKETMTDIGCSLEDLIDKFTEDMENSEPPQMHWLSPAEVLKKMETLEERCLQANKYRIKHGDPIEEAEQRLEMAEKKFQKILDSTMYKIESIKKAVVIDEKRLTRIDNACKNVIDRHVSRSVANDDALKLYSIVENAYEATIAKNDQNIGMLDMAIAINEKLYSLLQQFREMPPHIVSEVKTAVFSAREEAMHRAMRATKQLKYRKRLLNRLQRALEPPPPRRTTKPVMFRAPLPKKKDKAVEGIEVTKEDLLFLENFTDFIPGVHNPREWLEKEQSLRNLLEPKEKPPETDEVDLPRIPLVTTKGKRQMRSKKGKGLK
ncbi:uncharacterized protein [Anabrus simplex]|uniref:uncharacterized protein n=1 Tax=Anabrus simplex TaxID=316456 RepID=UPI0035A36911